jgi:hypothetical protein
MLHTKTTRSRPEPESRVSFIRVLAASSSLAEREDNSTYGWATTLLASVMEYRGRLRSARCTEYHCPKHLPPVHRTGGVRRESRDRALTFISLSLLTCTCCSRQARYPSSAGCHLYAIAFARPYGSILVRGVHSCWDVLL